MFILSVGESIPGLSLVVSGDSLKSLVCSYIAPFSASVFTVILPVYVFSSPSKDAEPAG